MQLHNGADHFGNVITEALLNSTAANEAIVKFGRYISEMFQNAGGGGVEPARQKTELGIVLKHHR